MPVRERKPGKKSGKAEDGQGLNMSGVDKKMRKFGAPLTQAAGVLSFAYACHWQMNVVKVPLELAPNRDKMGGVLKYLTFLNMVLQCGFFLIALIANFTGRRSTWAKTRDIIFASAAFPIGMFVGIVFWTLWAINRDLIFPVALDEYFPSWLNHLMHTTVIPLQLGEMLLTRHVYPSRKVGVAITAALTLAYLVWVNIIAYYGGFWVYPVMKVLSPMQRALFMGICSVGGGLLYLAGEALNSIVWPTKV